MFKFLHIADIHFDAPLTSRDAALGQDLKAGQRKAFNRAIDLCINKSVNGLIIAGDLFDNERISLQTEKFLWDQFARLSEAGIPVFYAPGNHDPVIAMQFKFNENVKIFDRDIPEEVVLTDESGASCKLVGVGHLNDREKRNLIRKFPVKITEDPIIGVAHAMVESIEAGQEKGRYLPTSLEDLAATGYDYWALGHIHQRQQMKDSVVHYSGTIQGLNINETGMKGGNLITVDGKRLSVEFVPLSSLIYAQCQVDISGTYDSELEFYHALKDRLAAEVEASGFSPGETILRAWISGRTNMMYYMKKEENIQYLEEELMRDLGLRAFEVKTQKLMGTISYEDLLKENPVIGEIIELIDHPEKDPKFIEALSGLKLRSEGGDKFARELLQANREQLIESLMTYFMGDES